MKKSRDRDEERDDDDDDREERRKKKRSKSSDDSDDGDDKSNMERFRDEWDEDDDEDGEKEDDVYFKPKTGKNTVRILPNKEEGEPWFVDWATHYNMGPDGETSFRCIEPGGPFGLNKKKDKQRGWKAKLCPACKKFCKEKTKARQFEFGSKAGLKFWRENVVPWRAKYSFGMALTLPKSDEPEKVWLYKCGVMVARPLIQAYYDTDQGGDFTDFKSGRNIMIKKVELGGGKNNVEYDTKVLPDRVPCKMYKKVRKNLPDLTVMLPEKLKPEAIMAIITGEGDEDDDELEKARAGGSKRRRVKDEGDMDDDADREEDDDDDDDDERESRRRPSKHRRTEDDDVDPDAEEDEDEDEDDDEDSDDDDDKKSSMKERLRKKSKRRRGDDD